MFALIVTDIVWNRVNPVMNGIMDIESLIKNPLKCIIHGVRHKKSNVHTGIRCSLTIISMMYSSLFTI